MQVSKRLIEEARKIAEQMIQTGETVKPISAGFFVVSANETLDGFSPWHEFSVGSRIFHIAWESQGLD